MQEEYIQHHTIHNPNSFTCFQCGKLFTKSCEFDFHLKITHQIGLFDCIFCQFNTASYSKIKTHLLEIHTSKPLYFSARRYWVRMNFKFNVIDLELINLRDVTLVATVP